MSRFKKYSFWVALMGAIVLLIENLASVFGFEFNKTIFESIFLSVCGILVVLGIIVKDLKDQSQNVENDLVDMVESNISNNEVQEDLNCEKDSENSNGENIEK